jgi:excisionase family DNA binding protein
MSVSPFSRFPPVLDVPGVADLLGISIEQVRRLAGEGWLPGARVGDRWLFNRDEVLTWFEAQKVVPDGEDPETGGTRTG